MPTYIARSELINTAEGSNGCIYVGSGAFRSGVSSRTKAGSMTNPQEMIGAAVASGFALKLAEKLSEIGLVNADIYTTAAVEVSRVDGVAYIPRISMDVRVDTDELEMAQLQQLISDANDACPESQALSNTRIEFNVHRIE